MLMGYLLTSLGGMLLGVSIIVLTFFWHTRRQRGHVFAISASYLLLVLLSMQPGLAEDLRFTTPVHSAIAVVAYLVGFWALWALVPTSHGKAPDKDEPVDVDDIPPEKWRG